ncbi:MAG TPA: hypothetical protein VHB21_09120 [Minicystis sp.]|nr:hypothetical protein [Minicystis sp.]
MDYAKFQLAVIDVAHEGTPLTVANVVARLRVEPEEAERKLDRMAKEGRLDLEVDETDGVVVYRVRGLTPKTVTEKLDALRHKVESEAIQHVGTALSFGKPFKTSGAPLPMALRRSVPLGLVLGGLFPGLGLAYAAPWSVVAVATIAVVVGFKVLSFFWLGVPFLMLAVLASAAAGAVYTWRYNQTGRRTAVFDAPNRPRLAR